MSRSWRRGRLAATAMVAAAAGAAVAARGAAAWDVLPDTDFPGNCRANPYGPGASASECADQCQAREDCVAVSWNGPGSKIHDGNCNFKCTTLGQHKDIGEQGVIVRSGQHLCDAPAPAPSPGTLCPAELMPLPGWHAACLGGDLLFSASATDGLWPEVGNGFVATVVQSGAVYAAGLFDGPDTDNTHRARIPALDIAPPNRGAPSGEFSTGRGLDVASAVFTQVSAISNTVRAVERWYAPAQQPSLLVHELEFTNFGVSATSVPLGLTYPVGGASADLDLTTLTDDDVALVVAGANKVPATPALRKTEVAFAANKLPPQVAVPGNNGSVTVYSLSSVATSLNASNATAAAVAILGAHTANDFALAKHLLEDHSRLWQARADAGHVEVTGNLDLAQAANASLYYIRSSIRPDWPFGLSPGGLASDSYHGHSFWDQETWMWPPLLMLDPQSAASALQYRFDRMPGAAAKAAGCSADQASATAAYCQPGYAAPSGALMFPWESAFSGEEAQNSKGQVGPWGRFEQHISGDIALAVRQYFYTTNDTAWLKAVGFPLVNGTATFFASRVEPSAHVHGALSYNMVMGPDEFAYPVNNSAYTNVVASIAMEFAAEAAGVLGLTGAVYDDFRAKAAALVVPFNASVPGRPDLAAGYHPEYDGFPKDPQHPTVKQADTVMLSYPLGFNMSAAVLADDLSFYDGITDQSGPAMTWSLFAIGWLNQGTNDTKSRRYFARGYANVKAPFKVWTETPTGGAVNFITGAGGFLQSLVFGATGLRIAAGELLFNPPAPAACDANVTKFGLHSFHYQGCRVRQEVSDAEVSFELLAPCAAGLGVREQASGAVHPLRLGAPVKVTRAPVALARVG